jgi:hypothetical protein
MRFCHPPTHISSKGNRVNSLEHRGFLKILGQAAFLEDQWESANWLIFFDPHQKLSDGGFLKIHGVQMS